MRDRVFSPLSFAFIVSWLVWNYKFLLVFFSDMKPYVKFSYISGQVYPDLLSSVFIGLIGPLATSLAYVLFYPFVTYGIMVVTNWHSNRIENLRIKNEGEAIMSEERAKAFKKEQREIIKKFEHELDESVERVRTLKGEAITAENKIIELIQEKNTEAEQANEEINKLTAELEDSKIRINEILSTANESKTKFDQVIALHNQLADQKNALNKELVSLRESSAAEIKQLKSNSDVLSSQLASLTAQLKKAESENSKLNRAALLRNLKDKNNTASLDTVVYKDPAPRKINIIKKPEQKIAKQPLLDQLSPESFEKLKGKLIKQHTKIIGGPAGVAIPQRRKSSTADSKDESLNEAFESLLSDEDVNHTNPPKKT